MSAPAGWYELDPDQGVIESHLASCIRNHYVDGQAMGPSPNYPFLRHCLVRVGTGELTDGSW